MAHWDRIKAVYMMANRKNGAIYTGVTGHLIQRVHQHKQGEGCDFTRKYGCKNLVWFEIHENMSEAIRREKSLKSYARRSKISLIEKNNPDWQCLAETLL